MAEDQPKALPVPVEGAPEEPRRLRFRPTAELATTELYQRRKRNICLFGAVVILLTLTNPAKEIPVPLLGEKVTLPVELAFFACILTLLYFSWEFYTDWETARRRNSEAIQAGAGEGRELGSELARFIGTAGDQFELAAWRMSTAITAIQKDGGQASLDLNDPVLRTSESLVEIRKQMPRWRATLGQLQTSYLQLHESVSRLQQMNFFIDLVVVTSLATIALGGAGYLVLRGFVQ